MYFYVGKNGRFYHNTLKTESVKNAQIRITACFNEDSDLVIYDVKRMAGTDLSLLLKTVKQMIDYTINQNIMGTKRIINESNKLPNAILHKIGFKTTEGCTLFEIG